MQKRFCSCGQEIWVQYILSVPAFQALFTTHERGGDLLHICPHCKNQLNINELH